MDHKLAVSICILAFGVIASSKEDLVETKEEETCCIEADKFVIEHGKFQAVFSFFLSQTLKYVYQLFR